MIVDAMLQLRPGATIERMAESAGCAPPMVRRYLRDRDEDDRRAMRIQEDE